MAKTPVVPVDVVPVDVVPVDVVPVDVVPVDVVPVDVVEETISNLPELLIQVKEAVVASDYVLKSQICTLLDQAIQASLVK